MKGLAHVEAASDRLTAPHQLTACPIRVHGPD
jgi:hypothetical protein